FGGTEIVAAVMVKIAWVHEMSVRRSRSGIPRDSANTGVLPANGGGARGGEHLAHFPRELFFGESPGPRLQLRGTELHRIESLDGGAMPGRVIIENAAEGGDRLQRAAPSQRDDGFAAGKGLDRRNSEIL